MDKKIIPIRRLETTIEVPVLTDYNEILEQFSIDDVIKILNTHLIQKATFMQFHFARKQRERLAMFKHWPSFGVMDKHDLFMHSLASMNPAELASYIATQWTPGKRDNNA